MRGFEPKNRSLNLQERGVPVLSPSKRPANRLVAGTKNFCPGTRMARSYKRFGGF